jgi:hypothetical protein
MSDAHKEKIRKALKEYWATIPYEEPEPKTATENDSWVNNEDEIDEL